MAGEEDREELEALDRAALDLEDLDLAELEAGELAELVDGHHPADVAAAVARLERDERAEVLGKLDSEDAAELSEHLAPQDVVLLLEGRDAGERGEVMAQLPDDVVVDVLQELEDDALREELVAGLPDADRGEIVERLNWREDSAGGRMTDAIAWLDTGMSVQVAMEELRAHEEDLDFVSRLFVTDAEGTLAGQLRLRDLIFHRPEQRLGKIIEPVRHLIEAKADQELAARMIQKYDLAALPVVDGEGKLLGAITADDAFEILQAEHTEDVEMAAGISPSEEGESYLGSSWWSLVRRRFPWVLILALVGTFSGLVIFRFEDTLARLFHLALYMPMVVAAGGNTGGQAATMVIRAMSLGEVNPGDALRIAGRELRIGLTLGILMGIAILLEILLMLPFRGQLPAGFDTLHIGLVVAGSLLVQITSSTMLGSMLPLAAKRLGIDPAAVASPALASIVDITGLFIYFGMAKGLLGI